MTMRARSWRAALQHLRRLRLNLRAVVQLEGLLHKARRFIGVARLLRLLGDLEALKRLVLVGYARHVCVLAPLKGSRCCPRQTNCKPLA